MKRRGTPGHSLTIEASPGQRHAHLITEKYRRGFSFKNCDLQGQVTQENHPPSSIC